jgi:YD repeat-containing protein
MTGCPGNPVWRPASRKTRRRLVTLPSGGTKAFDYDDGARRTTTASQSSCGGGSMTSRELYDPLGRLVRTEVDSEDSTMDTVERQYDDHGRLWRVSHPCRPGNPLWTTYSYDALDRLVGTAYPDNSGTEQRSYAGNETTIVEANGSQRRLTVDGLGRIQTASEFGPAQYDVAYGYDALDNLTAVTQGNRLPRSYGYDSLGRLVSASNPESGASSYTYDDSGNPVTRTNGGKTICWGVWGSGACNAATLGHDALNRPRQKSYSDGTPSVVYSYDARAHGYGRLCSVTAGTTTRSYSYAVAGRVAASEQNTDGRAYRFQYTGRVQPARGAGVDADGAGRGRVDGDELDVRSEAAAGRRDRFDRRRSVSGPVCPGPSVL